MAEGTFSVMDPETCYVELYWRRWAERPGLVDPMERLFKSQKEQAGTCIINWACSAPSYVCFINSVTPKHEQVAVID